MTKERFRFTSEILNSAEEMRRYKLSWETIAERLGCDAKSLEQTFWHRRAGSWKGAYEKREKRDALIEARIIAGVKPVAIARELGISPQSLSVILKRLGFDEEMREEYAREAKKAAGQGALVPLQSEPRTHK